MEFDLGPLTWVKGEIDQALQRAGEALDHYEASADSTALKFCRTHVHQAHGALAMVSLDGPALITESIEALLLGMEDERLPSGDSAIAVLRLALASLARYLDDLMAGEPNQALRLLPAYQALAGARTLPDTHPSDLFFPDLGRRPPRRGEAPAALDPAQALAALKAERMRFQKGLLTWLKMPADADAGRCLMRDALAAIEALQQTAPARVFWWISQALLEALADPALAADPQARHLCSRIDAQIRRLLDGSGNVAERVMREALYYIAQAPTELSPAIAEVQSVFGLRELLPAAAPTTVPRPEDDTLRRLREALATAEELWNKFCTGSNGGLSGFAEHARTCARLTEEIGHTDLKRLGQGLGAIANWLAEDPARFNDTVAMEVATAILLLQNAQDNFRRLGTDFAQQVDLMVARLYACIAGRPAADTGLPLLDEVTRQAQEKLLIGQVGREIQSNLAQIEQALDAFFRNPAAPHDLQQLDGPIKQISGALAMLGHFGAVNCLKECAAHIHRFAEPDYPPASADFEAVANQLSLLGFFVDALQSGEHDFEAFARRLQGTAPAEAGAEEAPSIEAEIVEQTREVQALAEALRESPADARLQDELKQNLQTLQKDADLVANRELGESAKAALAALQAGGPVEAALSALPAAAEAPPPSAETLQLAEAPHEAIDAELLAIFLEEARDVLAAIDEQKTVLAAKPADHEALTIIRRSTHTLKGSGRMVGLTDLGETAWQLEQTLNLWLGQDQSATPELLQMIAEEHALFTAWVRHLESGEGGPPDARPLIALACRLRGAEVPAEIPQPAPPMPAEVEAAPVAESEAAAAPPAEVAPEITPEIAQEVAPESAPEAAAEPTAEVLEMPRSTAETAEIPQVLTQTITVSPALYDIFLEEARGHLQTLRDSHAALEADPTGPTAFPMTRAAHTLGGIAATVGLMPINRLAIALEHALLRRDGSAQPDSIEGMETVRQAIITLEEMFAALARHEAPEDQAQLVDALGDTFPPAPAAATEALVSAEIIPLPIAATAPEPHETEPAIAAAPSVPQLTDEFDDQLLPIFLEEAADLLRDMTTQIHAWRADPAGGAAPQALGRLLHTFKGSARMAGAMNLGEATHLLEARVETAMHGEQATLAFIDDIEAGCDTLAQAVERLRHGPTTSAEAVAETAAALPTAEPAGLAPIAAEAETEAEAGGQRASLRVRADLIDRLVNEAGELSIARTRIEGEMRSLKSSLLDLTENVIRLRRQLREIEIQAETQIQSHVAQSPDKTADFDPLELDRFTRFQELTRFMAESVNDVATVQQNLLKNLDDANAAILAQARLNRSLQQELMGVRMLPFASQAERLYRVVRQAAKELGKRATLDIVGGQVDIDRSVLDKMLAPLEHMLRNAVTHGIEGRDERLAASKPETGEIVVSLLQEGNEIILSLADDGRGLDTARIRARAEAMGLLQPGEAVGETALFDFIFQPGFSTAAELTQLSGRGIGMDVVRTEVAALGGRIETVSQPGRGTTFRLYLPLTLAVTPTLLVRVGGQRYALPSTMIEQVMEMKEGGLADLREQGEAVWQGNHYPFHFLPHLLGDDSAVPEAHRQYWVLLLRSGSQRVALLVDELKGNQEVVVKNVGPQLARVVGIAGATVLGDGQVALILNPVALASRMPASTAHLAVPAAPQPVVEAAPLPTVMIVDDSLTVRKITSRLLMREGYQVLLAKDGVDALEQLIDTVPDVVLSDIEMPRMDGFDLLRNIRADARLSQLPIIMITSRTAEKHRNHALELGANHYLGKPYDEAELLGLIADYCKKAS